MPTFLSNGRRGLLAGLLALVVFVSSAIAMTTHGSIIATAAPAQGDPNQAAAVVDVGRDGGGRPGDGFGDGDGHHR